MLPYHPISAGELHSCLDNLQELEVKTQSTASAPTGLTTRLTVASKVDGLRLLIWNRRVAESPLSVL